MQHLAQKYAVLILYLGLALLFFELALPVLGDVSRLWRPLHVDTGLHIAQTVHVQQVLFNPLSFIDVAVGRVLDPHVSKNGDLNYNQF